jgi:hypothetical protein
VTQRRLKPHEKGVSMGVEEFEEKAKQEIEDRGGTDALK